MIDVVLHFAYPFPTTPSSFFPTFQKKKKIAPTPLPTLSPSSFPQSVCSQGASLNPVVISALSNIRCYCISETLFAESCCFLEPCVLLHAIGSSDAALCQSCFQCWPWHPLCVTPPASPARHDMKYKLHRPQNNSLVSHPAGNRSF